MSDQASQQAAPVGGWWMASDGKWYPPELHPSVTAPPPAPDAAGDPPTVVPELTDTASETPDRPTDVPGAVPHLSRWTETARVAAATTARAKGGTQLPDMLQQAMGDDGGDFGPGGDGSVAGDGAPTGVTTAGSGTPGVGEFTGASARRRRIRWR
jgi:hypothetical protein